jgi:dihydroflavonol-4-reductase
MKCMVTGATGFLGTHLVYELVKSGWDVRTFALPGSCVCYIEELPVEMLFGDLSL